MSSSTDSNSIQHVIDRLKDMNSAKINVTPSIDHILQKYLAEMMKELREILHTGFDQVIREIQKVSVNASSQSIKIPLPPDVIRSTPPSSIIPKITPNIPPLPNVPPTNPPPPIIKPSSEPPSQLPTMSQPMSALRDEMMLELERLKKIMRGEK